MSKRFFSSLFACALMLAAPLAAVASVPAVADPVESVRTFDPATEQIPAVQTEAEAAKVLPAVLRSNEKPGVVRVYVVDRVTGAVRVPDRSGRLRTLDPEPVPWRNI